jgi:hypothetical protein
VTDTRAKDRNEDLVREASEESFPASDPPAFVSTTGTRLTKAGKKTKADDTAMTEDRKGTGGGKPRGGRP